MGVLFTNDDGGLLHFTLISIILGGGLSWATGRAIASTWRPFWVVPVYMLVLAAAMRFLHYALVGEDLLDLQFYIVSFVVVMLGATYGYRAERVRQMTTQYSWLYAKSGPVGWQAKG